MAPKRRWNLDVDGENIFSLIKKQKINPTNLDRKYILKVKNENPDLFGDFDNLDRFVKNYKNTIAKIRSGELLEGARKKSK